MMFATQTCPRRSANVTARPVWLVRVKFSTWLKTGSARLWATRTLSSASRKTSASVRNSSNTPIAIVHGNFFAGGFMRDERENLRHERRARSTRARLLETLRCAARRGLLGHPRVERLLAFDDQHAARHGGMSDAAELRTVDLVAAFPGRSEMKRDPHARHGILRDAHGDDFE